jgi:spermidine synthase
MVNRQSVFTNLLSYLTPYCIEQREGKITSRLEVVLNNGKLLLNTNKVNYSYGSLHDIFLQTFKKINVRERTIKRTLILGFGAGSVAVLLRETFHKSCQIVGIEADEIVIELARKHFAIGRFEDLCIQHLDAYNYVMNCTDSFDMIIVDLFIHNHTPERFSDRNFLMALGRMLGPAGVICYNRMVDEKKSRCEAESLIGLVEQNIGPCFLIQYNRNQVMNWMIVHDRNSLLVHPGPEEKIIAPCMFESLKAI